MGSYTHHTIPHTHTHTHTHIHTHMHSLGLTHTHIHTHIYTHTYTHAHAHTGFHIGLCMCIIIIIIYSRFLSWGGGGGGMDNNRFIALHFKLNQKSRGKGGGGGGGYYLSFPHVMNLHHFLHPSAATLGPLPSAHLRGQQVKRGGAPAGEEADQAGPPQAHPRALRPGDSQLPSLLHGQHAPVQPAQRVSDRAE